MKPVAAAIAVAGTVGALTGCGGSSSGAPSSGAPVVVDDALRGAVAHAPADARSTVRFQPSSRTLATAFSRSAAGTIVIASTQFPAWNTEDRVRDGRVVATDRIVLVTRSDHPRSPASLARSVRIALVTRPATVKDATAETFDALAGANGASTGTGSHRTGVPVPSVDAAVSALSARRVDAALVPLSSYRQPAPGTRVRRLSVLAAPELLYQVGVLKDSAPGRRLRAWLAGTQGQRALRNAGFGGPGRYPTSEPAP